MRSFRNRISSIVLAIALVSMPSDVAAAQGASGARGARNIELYSELLAMTDSRTYGATLVDSALNSGWPPLRAAAALAVGQIGATHGIAGAPRLRELLTDRDLTVASNAAYALGLLRDSASIPMLSAALGGSPRVAREAAWALGEIGAPARRAITSALAKSSTDEARTIQLLLAAAKLRPVPITDLRPYLKVGNSPSVIWAASYAIARIRVPAGTRDLIALANEPSFMKASSQETRAADVAAAPRVPPTAEAYLSPRSGRQRARAEIARGLAKSAAGDSLGANAMSVLSRLAVDHDPHVRINAVRSLATYGPKARALVVAATRDRDANTRITAAQSLGTVLDSAVASWRPMWSADTSFMYRSSLLASAIHAGAMLPEFTSWQGHPDWRYRAATLDAVGPSPNKKLAFQLGTEMTADNDARVREAAYSAIAGSDSILTEAEHDALIRGLSDPDFMVRATVLGPLARRANAVDASTVIDAYTRSLRDPSNDARIAAIHYLTAAWKLDSAAFPALLRDRIGRLTPSPDPLVRAEAAHVSVFQGWETLAGTARTLDWYGTLVRTYVLPAIGGNRQRSTISTPRGDIVLELFGAEAPITINNFLTLARSGYYRGTKFHRVVPNFVAQDGDPRGDGNGGPGYAIRDEMNPRRYDRGALGMALSGPDTGGSQYFITHSPQPHLDGHYTVFGRVVRGFRALDAIIQGDSILAVRPQ